jgi:hypothetical protein
VVEQRPFKAWVAGSNPAALTISFQRLENSASSKNGVLVQIRCRLRNLAGGKGHHCASSARLISASNLAMPDNQVWLPHFDVALPRSGHIGVTQNPLDEKIIVRHQFVQTACKPAPKGVPEQLNAHDNLKN